MDARVGHSVGSAGTILGALAIGWALHAVLNGRRATSFPVVASVAVGVALVAGGRLVERRFEGEALGIGTDDEADGAEYDDALAPVDEAALEKYDRDDDYDRSDGD